MAGVRQIYNDIVKMGSHAIWVGTDDQEVSEKPLYSVGYYFCRAVILKGDQSKGLPHILPWHNPLHYILRMIDKMRPFPKEFKAITVDVDCHDLDDKYPFSLEECCNRLGIEIVDRYLGKYFLNEEGKPRTYQKDILVRPTLDQVLVYSQDQPEVLSFN
jgi:hypothetical protein